MKDKKSDAWNFIYNNFAGEWHNGVPLGNGDLGALMVPCHRQTTFALAKADVWDERCDDGSGIRRSFRAAENFNALRNLINRQEWSQIEEDFRERLSNWKGKFLLLPAASLVLNTARFEKEIELLDFSYQLDMEKALGRISHTTRVRTQNIEAVVSAKEKVLAIRVQHKSDWRKGNPPRQLAFGIDISLQINASDKQAKIESGSSEGVIWRQVSGYHKVDYTIAILASGEEVQTGNERLTVCAKAKADFTIFAAIVSNKDSKSPKEEALKRVKEAAKLGFEPIRREHQRWWRKFWNASRIAIPDKDITRQYHFGLYLLGSSSRKGHPMPGLQGLWTTKPEGSEWNDYTNDLDIEMNYWPIYASNHLELGWPYYETVRKWIPEAQRFTREYWGCRGAQFSSCTSPDGIMPPGYVTTSHCLGLAAFVAQNFWTHYQFSKDVKFLKDVAYPILKECALFYVDFLKKDKKGLYEIGPSSSPECAEGSYEAWGKNTTMDIALISLLFRAVIEGANTLSCDSDLKAAYQERLDHMPPYPVSKGSLIEMESKEFLYSHRHPGMLTAVYPCADVTGKLAECSIDRYIGKGKWQWCGFSPVWVAGACARVGRGEQALEFLREFMEVFTLRQGGFHFHFDYSGTGRGQSGPKCFTNETNSGFSASLLEMLLQSHNQLISIFPALPKAWKDAAFKTLRAEGAFLVSAVRKDGETIKVEILSEKGGVVRLKNPWAHAPNVTSNGSLVGVASSKGVLSWQTKANSIYKLTVANGVRKEIKERSNGELPHVEREVLLFTSAIRRTAETADQ